MQTVGSVILPKSMHWDLLIDRATGSLLPPILDYPKDRDDRPHGSCERSEPAEWLRKLQRIPTEPVQRCPVRPLENAPNECRFPHALCFRKPTVASSVRNTYSAILLPLLPISQIHPRTQSWTTIMHPKKHHLLQSCRLKRSQMPYQELS
jgi:hypothetical protein